LLALYLVFFLLPFFFFPVELLDTIATSNLQLSAISLFMISYALRMPLHLSFSKRGKNVRSNGKVAARKVSTTLHLEGDILRSDNCSARVYWHRGIRIHLDSNSGNCPFFLSENVRTRSARQKKMKKGLFVLVEVEYGDLYVPHIDDLVIVNVSIGIPVD
jgi:hypothetical protein